jgi:hypothetical protein
LSGSRFAGTHKKQANRTQAALIYLRNAGDEKNNEMDCREPQSDHHEEGSLHVYRRKLDKPVLAICCTLGSVRLEKSPSLIGF